MLIDGGLPSAFPIVREQLRRAVPVGSIEIDLIVVSHIDSDHIGGLLALLADPTLDLRIGDIWFNGLPQLPEKTGSAKRSVSEGEQLVAALTGSTGGRALPWNEAFGRAAAMTADDGAFREIVCPQGPTLTLLSPTPRRLTALRRAWVGELGKLRRGLPSEDEVPTPVLPLEDLEALAGQRTPLDGSPANGSSIAFLLEHLGCRLLLAADAFSSVLGQALTSLANARDGKPIELDLFKLPHHCSSGNVTAPLLRVAPAAHYVVSTNGDRFQHPDDAALARIVVEAAARKRKISLWFNYATHASERWSRPDLRLRYGYEVRAPGPDQQPGIRIELPIRKPEAVSAP